MNKSSKWILSFSGDRLVCANCGMYYPLKEHLPPYCSMCGAYMKNYLEQLVYNMEDERDN